jgi:hypothetical protein
MEMSAEEVWQVPEKAPAMFSEYKQHVLFCSFSDAEG